MAAQLCVECADAGVCVGAGLLLCLPMGVRLVGLGGELPQLFAQTGLFCQCAVCGCACAVQARAGTVDAVSFAGEPDFVSAQFVPARQCLLQRRGATHAVRTPCQCARKGGVGGKGDAVLQGVGGRRAVGQGKGVKPCRFALRRRFGRDEMRFGATGVQAHRQQCVCGLTPFVFDGDVLPQAACADRRFGQLLPKVGVFRCVCPSGKGVFGGLQSGLTVVQGAVGGFGFGGLCLKLCQFGFVFVQTGFVCAVLCQLCRQALFECCRLCGVVCCVAVFGKCCQLGLLALQHLCRVLPLLVLQLCLMGGVAGVIVGLAGIAVATVGVCLCFVQGVLCLFGCFGKGLCQFALLLCGVFGKGAVAQQGVAFLCEFVQGGFGGGALLGALCLVAALGVQLFFQAGGLFAQQGVFAGKLVALLLLLLFLAGKTGAFVVVCGDLCFGFVQLRLGGAAVRVCAVGIGKRLLPLDKIC